MVYLINPGKTARSFHHESAPGGTRTPNRQGRNLLLYPLSYGRIGTPPRCTSLRFAVAGGNAGAPIGRVPRCCVTMDGMRRSEQQPLLAQLAELVGEYSDELNSPIQQFDVGGSTFGAGCHPALMGVTNLSR